MSTDKQRLIGQAQFLSYKAEKLLKKGEIKKALKLLDKANERLNQAQTIK